MSTTIFSGLMLILSITIISLIWKYFILRTKLNNVPGPKTILFIWQLLKIPKEDRLQWFNDLCFKYKDGIVLTWIGPKPMVIIRKPEYIEAILSRDEFLHKSWIYNKLISPWLGNAIFTTSGSTWARYRKMLSPSFHSSVLKNYGAVIRNKTKDFVDKIELKLRDNKNSSINISELAAYYTLDSICEAAMGVNLHSQGNSSNEYIKALTTYKQLAYERISRIWLMWDTLYYLTSKGKECRRAIKTLHDFSEKVIRERQLQRYMSPKNVDQNEIDEYGVKKKKAVLDLLLDENEKVQDPLTFLELREEVDTFMAGGNDTITSTLNWTLFAIGNNPEIQDKIQDELKEIFGDQTETATLNQLAELNYLERVIKESLRIFPIAPVISRCLDKDTVIGHYSLPKGTTIQINIYQLHHDPEVWENPEKFDPDRFLPDNIRSKSQYAFIPWSAGPRTCLGMNYAMMELKISLSSILRRWKVCSVLKTSEMKMVVDFVLEPWNGVMELYFTPLQ